MRIPDSVIDDIRAASDLVEVISQYVPLKRRGKNYVGLCPFHQEKTPSFSVSPEKQMYYCFGCAKGGNVFTFVMEHDKVSFAEAARTLAKRAGIFVPEESPEDSALATENEKLFTACRIAAEFYSANLHRSGEGALALGYFKHRGFTEETIQRFGLGYSLNAWDGLAKSLERSKLDPVHFERAGLIMKRDDGSGYYDRFRGRAMFPFYSASGRLIAFGARKLHEDDPLGKYVNSPETPIFDKSRVLYGLFQAREALRAKEFAVLVEGYVDLISVFQVGIENVVASSGTALTEQQIRLIGRYTRTIILVYDADSAGSRATLRGVDLILGNGLDVRVATLPQGEDPDSFVRKNGGQAFALLLEKAASFLEFKADYFRGQGLLATPEGKTKAVRSLVETLARIPDELKRTIYLKSLAEKYDIYESVLFRELEHLLGRRGPRSLREEPGGPPLGEAAQGGSEVHSGDRQDPPPAERDLVRVMLLHKAEAIGFVFRFLTIDHFHHPLTRAAAELLLRHQGDDWEATALVDRAVDPELKNFIAGLLALKYEISPKWASIGSQPDEPDARRIAEDAILRMKTEELDRRIEDIHRQMKLEEGKGCPTLPFTQQILVLQREKMLLKTNRLAEEPGS
jgi:DNA primase